MKNMGSGWENFNNATGTERVINERLEELNQRSI